MPHMLIISKLFGFEKVCLMPFFVFIFILSVFLLLTFMALGATLTLTHFNVL